MPTHIPTSSPNQQVQVAGQVATRPYPFVEHQSTDELADFLLGLAVLTRIAGGEDLMNIFSTEQTILVLREVAKRLRNFDWQQQRGMTGTIPAAGNSVPYPNHNDWQKALEPYAKRREY